MSNKLKILSTLILLGLVVMITAFNLNPAFAASVPQQEFEPGKEFQQDTYRAKVLSIHEKTPAAKHSDLIEKIQVLEVEMTSGPYEGKVAEVDNEIFGDDFYDLNLQEGDRIFLRAETLGGEIEEIYVQDYLRDTYIYIATAGLAFLLLIIGGGKGLKTILTLAFAILVIFQVMLPLIAKGYNPLWLSVLLTSLVALICLCIIGGINKKTLVAIAGTIGGVIVAGILALIVGEAANLTGFSNQEAQLLQYTDIGEIDVQGLLFAGIIIGALGAVMDIGMSIASACSEMKELNPRIEKNELFKAGMNVGRDIMGTMSNTLVLAYIGSAMPLFLLFIAQDMTVTNIINLDVVSTEIIRAIVGSMGLLVAIPITALTASIFFCRKRDRTRRR